MAGRIKRSEPKSNLGKAAGRMMKKTFGGKVPSEKDLPAHMRMEMPGSVMTPPPSPPKGFQYLKYLARIPGLRNKEGQGA